MRNKIILLFILLFISCKSKTNDSKKESNNSNDNIDLIGEDIIGFFDRSELLKHPYSLWFDRNYENYKVNDQIIEKIKPYNEDFEITIFMGTWCEESQKDLPVFFKILDLAKVKPEKIQLIGMTEDKKTPDNLEKDLDIFNIPTYIFKKNGEEINRIVEFPVETLEKDFYKIVSGQEYKNIYADF